MGHVLFDSGLTLSHVYFPTTAVVSPPQVMEDGVTAEVAVVGNEGIVGIALFMGGGSTPGLALVQCAGQGFRVPGKMINDEFSRSAPVMHLLLRYTQALITQMAKSAVCSRTTRWISNCAFLLLTIDRVQGNEPVLTQELITNMLGVRGEGGTESALGLQKVGLIRCSRGHISVLDRAGL